MKNIKTRQLIHVLVFIIGLILMIGGIITGKHGATVGGIILAAVNVLQWIEWNKKGKQQK